MDYTQALYRHADGELVVPYWQYDVDATEPASWPELERRFGTLGIDRPFLEWFAERFTYEGPLDAPGSAGERPLAARAAWKGTTLVLINGAEVELDNPREPARHLHHRRMNEALERVVAELPATKICDVREFVTSPRTSATTCATTTGARTCGWQNT